MARHVAHRGMLAWAFTMFAMGLAACSGAGGFGGAANQKGKSDKDAGKLTGPSKEQDGGQGEDEASAPVSVAGSFLVQTYNSAQSNDNVAAINVTVKRKGGEPVGMQNIKKFEASLAGKALEAEAAQEGDDHHFTYKVPMDDIDKENPHVSVFVSIDGQEGKVESRQSIATMVVRAAVFGLTGNYIKPENIPLQGNNIDTIWKMGFDPFAACEGGKVNSGLKSQADFTQRFMSNFGGDGAGKSLFEIKPTPQISENTDEKRICFDPISLMQDPKKDPKKLMKSKGYVFSQGCLHLFTKRDGVKSVLIVDKIPRSNAFKSKVDAYVTARQCK